MESKGIEKPRPPHSMNVFIDELKKQHSMIESIKMDLIRMKERLFDGNLPQDATKAAIDKFVSDDNSIVDRFDDVLSNNNSSLLDIQEILEKIKTFM